MASSRAMATLAITGRLRWAVNCSHEGTQQIQQLIVTRRILGKTSAELR
ncbi:hypothetical protein ACQPZ2_10250 [Nocardia pseudovaccinii]